MDIAKLSRALLLLLLLAAGAGVAHAATLGANEYFVMESTGEWTRDAAAWCANSHTLNNPRQAPWIPGTSPSGGFDCRTSDDGAEQEGIPVSSCGSNVPDLAAKRCVAALPPPPACTDQVAGPYPVFAGYKTGPNSNSPDVPGGPGVAATSKTVYCNGGCEIQPDVTLPFDSRIESTASAGGYYAVRDIWTFRGNRNQCTATPDNAPTKADPPPPVAPADKNLCPPGTVSGGIDSGGTPICIGSGTPGTKASTTTDPVVHSTNAAGERVDTATVHTTNPDGSVTNTTVSTTTHADGSITTDVQQNTGAAPNGTPGKAGTAAGAAAAAAGAPDPAKDLCTLHPELNICKNSSVSGACDQVACQGDAIQCAQLRTDAARRCDELKYSDEANAAKALSGNNMTGLPTATNGTSVDVAQMVGTLDQSGFAGGGACFPDKTVAFMGRSLTISMSGVCPYLEYLKYVVMLCAMIGAYKIVGGSILRET